MNPAHLEKPTQSTKNSDLHRVHRANHPHHVMGDSSTASSWICDRCRDPITDPSSAWVVFTYDRADISKAGEFNIVHPNNYGKRCDPGWPASIPLERVLGPAGLSYLLSFLSAGPLAGGSRINVADMNAFVDLVRRVQIPWYEQARSYWTAEGTVDHFSDANEYMPYLPDYLEQIAKQQFD